MEDLPLGRIAALVPEFALKDLPLGRTLMMMMMMVGSVNVHFLHDHLRYFPENLGTFREEHGKSFHQDIKQMETRYRGNWNVSMMADYSLMLKRDVLQKPLSRKSRKQKFQAE